MQQCGHTNTEICLKCLGKKKKKKKVTLNRSNNITPPLIQSNCVISRSSYPTSTDTNSHHNLSTSSAKKQRQKEKDAPKLLAGLHVQRPWRHRSSSAGQCVYGGCSYPISRKKWILSVPANRAAPIECTGASPHRCRARDRQSGKYKMEGRRRTS